MHMEQKLKPHMLVRPNISLGKHPFSMFVAKYLNKYYCLLNKSFLAFVFETRIHGEVAAYNIVVKWSSFTWGNMFSVMYHPIEFRT